MVNSYYADVAQSVVHLIRNQKVASSNLAISSTRYARVAVKPASTQRYARVAVKPALTQCCVARVVQ